MLSVWFRIWKESGRNLEGIWSALVEHMLNVAASMQSLIGHDLTKADFENPEVLNAANPSGWGFHHGPYFKENNPNKVSKVNGSVCWAAISGDQMCGMIFCESSAYWRHVRTKHEARIETLSRKNITVEERVAGENALKRLVLERGWHNARFILEPGRGPINGLLDRYATACERIAQFDPAFAERWGTKFHRQQRNADVISPRGKRHAGPMAPAEAPPTPTNAQRRQHLATIGAPGSFKARLQNVKAANAADKNPEVSEEEEEEEEEDEEEEDEEEDEEEEDEEEDEEGEEDKQGGDDNEDKQGQ